MSSITNSINYHVNTSPMYNRKQVKVENLHRLHQEKVADFYRVKQQDFMLNHTNLKDWEMIKNLEDINRYMVLKKNVEYGLYKYSKYLGNHIDITV